MTDAAIMASLSLSESSESESAAIDTSDSSSWSEESGTAELMLFCDCAEATGTVAACGMAGELAEDELELELTDSPLLDEVDMTRECSAANLSDTVSSQAEQHGP